MFPGVIRPPTHAGPPGRKRASQHLTHLSKRHRCQMDSGCLQKRTLTLRLSHHSLPMLGSYPLPAVVSRLHFQNAKRRKSSTGTPSLPPPRINLDPLVLETMRRPGCRAPKKVIKALHSDTDHPTTATRDAWAAIQTTTQQHEPSPCDPDATSFTTVPTPVHPRCQFLLAAMPPVRVRLHPRCLSPRAHRQSTRAHRLFQWTLRTALLSFAAFWVSATSDQWQERDEWEASHPSGCTTGTPHHAG